MGNVDYSEYVSKMNHLGVFGAAVAAAVAGALWFSPVLFAKPWMRELRLEDGMPARPLLLLIASSFLINLITAYLLELVMGLYSVGPGKGLVFGLLVGVGWVATSIGMNYLFEGRSLKLFSITAGYHVVRFGLMGLILGLWG